MRSEERNGGATPLRGDATGLPLFRVKICGIVDPADAVLAATAGADAIGLNFVSGSPRHLDQTRARDIASFVPEGVLRVGVFAGADSEEIIRTVERCGLDAVQLHGLVGVADPPELCRELFPLPVLRAVRMEGGSFETARRWVDAAQALGRLPRMLLLDASTPPGTPVGRLGGTGETVDWRAVGREARLTLPLVLAGGLRPDNVATAIELVRPAAVDVASGVEVAPGRKSPELVRAFVAAARAALAGLD